MGGDPSQTAPPGGEQGIIHQQPGTSVSSAPMSVAGMDLAQQLQHIVRGELRRMMEVWREFNFNIMGLMGSPCVSSQGSQCTVHQ